MEIPANCSALCKDSKIALRDNGNKTVLYVNNKERKTVEKIKIDGCVITGTERLRCDFLLNVDNNDYYVELKGSDVKHGILQLESTIQCLRRSQNKMNAILVYLSCPLATSEMQKAMKRFKNMNIVFKWVRSGSHINI